MNLKMLVLPVIKQLIDTAVLLNLSKYTTRIIKDIVIKNELFITR